MLRKGANFVRNYADDVINGVKLKKGGKFAKTVAQKVSNLEKKVSKLYELDSKNNLTSLEDLILPQYINGFIQYHNHKYSLEQIKKNTRRRKKQKDRGIVYEKI